MLGFLRVELLLKLPLEPIPHVDGIISSPNIITLAVLLYNDYIFKREESIAHFVSILLDALALLTFVDVWRFGCVQLWGDAHLNGSIVGHCGYAQHDLHHKPLHLSLLHVKNSTLTLQVLISTP